MGKIKVLLVDDHPLVLDGIKSMLTQQKGVEVIAQAMNAADALSCLKTQEPDVTLLDINLPDKDGVELCKIISKKHPKVKVIALTTFNEVSFIKSIMKAGARGYLLKNTTKEELIEAITTVNDGGEFLANEVKEKLISASFGQKDESFIPKLTRREKEVLTLIIDEMTTKEIAEKLFISVATIETHRLHLLNKIGVRNTAGLVKVAIQKGLV